MKQLAGQTGKRAEFKCGPYELLRVVQAGQKAVEEANQSQQLVLRAARRNGLLAWRPSLPLGRLQRSEEQQWASDKPEQSKRLHPQWLKRTKA
jgi:hypothetical protein